MTDLPFHNGCEIPSLITSLPGSIPMNGEGEIMWAFMLRCAHRAWRGI